ncbi:class I SAM-dependent methyltransferase [Terriglobus tenax]|uniref:class I SAM-dependent methyltransferase n=1 Tax=Terriglobus tenax TaxID=1111115 RepID=UPI0021E0EC72|nr:class I SAM-dependent methyltransferase [Terriglobus tenax]
MFTYKDIPNHFSFEDVYDLVLNEAPDGAVFVEIGTWLGASSAYMASKIRQGNRDVTMYAIDNFTAEGSNAPLPQQAMEFGGSFFHVFRENLAKCGVADMVKPIVGDSTDTAKQFEDGSLDFVYIDACHQYKKVKQDIEAWLPKVKPGGTIAGHDYDDHHPGVIKAVDEIFGKDGIRVMTHSWVRKMPVAAS